MELKTELSTVQLWSLPYLDLYNLLSISFSISVRPIRKLSTFSRRNVAGQSDVSNPVL